MTSIQYGFINPQQVCIPSFLEDALSYLDREYDVKPYDAGSTESGMQDLKP